jgi:hypothetical protein
MNTQEPELSPEDFAAEKTSRAEPLAGESAPWLWFGRVRSLAVLGGLLAGLLAFASGEATYEIIPIEKVERDLMGSKVLQSSPVTRSVGLTKNGALTFGLLGLCLGSCLGMAGGLARRSISGAVSGTVLGLVMGLALGAGVSWFCLPRFIDARLHYAEYDLMLSLGMHGLIWGSIGAAAGLAFAVGLGKLRLCLPSLIAGFLGALMGAFIFDLIGGAAFPMAECDEPISNTWMTRLMARLLVTLGAALTVVLFLPESESAARPDQSEAAHAHGDSGPAG